MQQGQHHGPAGFWSLALWLTLALSPSSGQISAEDWQPLQRSQHGSLTTYHGNSFQREPLQIRYGGVPNFNYDPSLVNHIPASGGSLLSSSVHAPSGDGCSLSKVAFNQDQYYQYVQYRENLPDLKEFTLCMWTKFSNHSNDHPLFSYSYSAGDQSKGINSWVSNTERASYYSLSVNGHTFYRLNYPLRLNRWYHSCQSWNGKTGEWQIWVNGERTGRGFHNRLVGHVIKGGGSAISGQEQNNLDGYQENGKAPKAPGGMLGEITMVQLYHVALTAGKAHKDHKHHHVHHFDHNGTPLETTTAQPFITNPPPSPNSLLIGGQINPMLELNLGGAPQFVPAQLPNGLQLNAQLVNGQFNPARSISEQLLNTQLNSNRINAPRNQGVPQFIQYPGPSLSPPGNRLLLPAQFAPTASVQFLDSAFGRHSLIKRDGKNANAEEKPVENKRNKRDNPEKEMAADVIAEQGSSKRQSKRGLVALSDGSIVDDGLTDGESFEQSLLIGLAGLGENIPVQNIQKEMVDEREPAEAEVRAVMDICSGCAEEPFQKALVLSWRHTPKKLFSGALYYPAVPACKSF